MMRYTGVGFGEQRLSFAHHFGAFCRAVCGRLSEVACAPGFIVMYRGVTRVYVDCLYG